MKVEIDLDVSQLGIAVANLDSIYAAKREQDIRAMEGPLSALSDFLTGLQEQVENRDPLPLDLQPEGERR